MNYHPEELITPKWMDNEFFEKILINFVGDITIKVKDFQSVPACPIGVHYASIIYRVNVSYSSNLNENLEKRSFIIKTMPNVDGLLKDILSTNDPFQTEISMYTNILPEMNKLLELSGYQNVIMAPKLMSCGTSIANKRLTMDDLSQYGYIGTDKALNFEAATIVARKLGEFHAMSFFMNHNQTNFIKYNYGVLSKSSTITVDLISKTLDDVNEEIKIWPELRKYSENLDEFDSVALDRTNKLYSENQNGINVLNHGDFHFRNLLFKFDAQGNVNDTIFVDYQFCIWASPAIDLIYLLYAISSVETRENHRDELIHTYYKEFSIMLDKLQFTGSKPTLLDFQMEILKNGFFELFMLATICVYLNFDFKKHNFEIMFQSRANSKAFTKEIINIPEVAETFKKHIPMFVKKGFL